MNGAKTLKKTVIFQVLHLSTIKETNCERMILADTNEDGFRYYS